MLFVYCCALLIHFVPFTVSCTLFMYCSALLIRSVCFIISLLYRLFISCALVHYALQGGAAARITKVQNFVEQMPASNQDAGFDKVKQMQNRMANLLDPDPEKAAVAANLLTPDEVWRAQWHLWSSDLLLGDQRAAKGNRHRTWRHQQCTNTRFCLL